MIIWIDGTCGIGKTSVAFALKEMLLDDEVEVLELDSLYNSLLKEALENPRKVSCSYLDIEDISQCDIQIYESFRDMIEERAEKIVIVDTAIMDNAFKTIVFENLSEKYRNILHIILTADEKTIKRRIDEDDTREDKSFAFAYLQKNLSFANENFTNAIRIKTDNRSKVDIANEILGRIKSLKNITE